MPGDFSALTSIGAKSFTKPELRALEHLAVRIKFDLAAAPDTPATWPWRDRQTTALAVIEERIEHGR